MTFGQFLLHVFFGSHTSESIFNGVEAFCGFCFCMEVHRSIAFFSILSYTCPLDRSRGSSYLISTGWGTRVNIAEIILSLAVSIITLALHYFMEGGF